MIVRVWELSPYKYIETKTGRNSVGIGKCEGFQFDAIPKNVILRILVVYAFAYSI